MKLLSGKPGFGDYCINIALLLYAIAPVTEKKDVVFFLDNILSVVFVVLYVINSCVAYGKDREKFLSGFTDITPNTVFNGMVIIAGIAVGYSMDLPNVVMVWCFFLFLYIIYIVIPARGKR